MSGTIAAVDINPPTAPSGQQLPIASIQDAAGNWYQVMVAATQSGTSDPAVINSTNPMPVAITSGGIPASSDESTFTPGTTQGVPVFGLYEDSVGALTSAQMGALRLSLNRQLQVALGASQTDGWTMGAYVAPATPAVQLLKNGQGKIGVIAACNSDTTWTYLKIWDASSGSPPTLGSTAANWSLPIPPGGGNNPQLVGGLQFTSGCYYAITGGPALLDNTGITVSKSQVNFGWN